MKTYVFFGHFSVLNFFLKIPPSFRALVKEDFLQIEISEGLKDELATHDNIR